MNFADTDEVEALRRTLLLFLDEQVSPAELRFADGPDAVHRNQIGRLELREHQEENGCDSITWRP